MALKVVNFKIQDYGGSPRTRKVWITPSQVAALVGAPGLELPAAPIPVTIAGDGSASVSLQANDDLSPTGGHYTLNVPTGDAVDATFDFIVPQGAGPFDLSQILTPPLGLPPVNGHVSTMTVDGTTDFAGTVRFGLDPFVDPRHPSFGAKGDMNQVADVACTNGSKVVTSASGKFTSADVGRSFDLYMFPQGAGINGTQSGTIESYQSPTQVTLSVAANANAVNATLTWGTADTSALNAWLAAPGRHLLGSTIYFVPGPTGLVAPAGATKIIEGFGGIWAGALLGATALLTLTGKSSTLRDFNMNASRGFTGRLISWSVLPENSTNNRLINLRLFSANDGGDYLIFLDGLGDTYLENIWASAIGGGSQSQLVNKLLAVNIPNSLAGISDSTMPGRWFVNAQNFSAKGCTTGPLRLGNNSVRDGSGTSQSVNTVQLDGMYIYNAAVGATYYPCIQSVVVSAAGEGAVGGVLPNINADASYFIFGDGDNTAKWACSGNMGASQGAVDATFKACGFVQSAASTAATVTLFISTGGSGMVIFQGSNANSLALVTTAKIFAITGGQSDCIVIGYMASGQAVKWQHPTLSQFSIANGALALPIGTWAQNTLSGAMDFWITGALTKVEISPDNGATVYQLWTGVGSAAVPTHFRWPVGSYIRFTGGPATYMLVPTL